MLNLSVRPGEYLMVGGNVKIIFVGGTGNNIHLMIDAPKEVGIVRSKAAEKAGEAESVFYGRKRAVISDAAQREIARIVREDRRKGGPAKAAQ